MLVNVLRNGQEFTPQDFQNLRVPQDAFANINIEDIHTAIIPLMYQTGYLTIKETDTSGATPLYLLGFPNEEVRISLFNVLLSSYTNHHIRTDAITQSLEKALKNKRPHEFMKQMQAFFRLIPYDICPYTAVPQREAYYQSIFYTALTVMGFNIQVELATNIGRIDATVTTENTIFIIEFKLNKTAEAALSQIQNKEYCQAVSAKPANATKEIVAIGANFSTESRNIDDTWLVCSFEKSSSTFTPIPKPDNIED